MVLQRLFVFSTGSAALVALGLSVGCAQPEQTNLRPFLLAPSSLSTTPNRSTELTASSLAAAGVPTQVVSTLFLPGSIGFHVRVAILRGIDTAARRRGTVRPSRNLNVPVRWCAGD